MATPIITPTVIRGQLMFVIGNVAVPDLRTALCAWSALDAARREHEHKARVLDRICEQLERETAAAARAPLDQYQQDIWDSFPQLQKPVRAGGAS